MADNVSSLTRNDYINLEEGLGRVRDNKKLFRKMLGMFLESGEFASLEESLTQKEYDKAADYAHAIKGITGNLGMTELFRISTKMMEDLRLGAPDEDSQAALCAAYSITRQYVEDIMAELAE